MPDLSAAVPLGQLGARDALIGRAEIDTAHDHNIAIRDQHLAMIAIVDGEPLAGMQRIGRIELQDLYPRTLQPREEFRRCTDGADTVVDDLDLYSRLRFGDQQIAELFAVATHILECVVLEIQVPRGAVDGREHRGEGLRAVAQDLDLVAGEQGALGNGLLDSQVALEGPGIRRLSSQLAEYGA